MWIIFCKQFQSAILQKWIFPGLLCKIVPFVATVTNNASIFTLLAISIDRFRVTIQPFEPKLKVNHCKFIIAFIWLLSIALSLVKLINFKITEINDIDVCEPFDETLHKIETFCLLAIQYVLPGLFISFIYIRIGCKFLKKNQHITEKQVQTIKRNKHV